MGWLDHGANKIPIMIYEASIGGASRSFRDVF